MLSGMFSFVHVSEERSGGSFEHKLLGISSAAVVLSVGVLFGTLVVKD